MHTRNIRKEFKKEVEKNLCKHFILLKCILSDVQKFVFAISEMEKMSHFSLKHKCIVF